MRKQRYIEKKQTLYKAPGLRYIRSEAERSFLTSNTEPIEGGNDPDEPWE